MGKRIWTSLVRQKQISHFCLHPLSMNQTFKSGFFFFQSMGVKHGKLHSRCVCDGERKNHQFNFKLILICEAKNVILWLLKRDSAADRMFWTSSSQKNRKITKNCDISCSNNRPRLLRFGGFFKTLVVHSFFEFLAKAIVRLLGKKWSSVHLKYFMTLGSTLICNLPSQALSEILICVVYFLSDNVLYETWKTVVMK